MKVYQPADFPFLFTLGGHQSVQRPAQSLARPLGAAGTQVTAEQQPGRSQVAPPLPVHHVREDANFPLLLLLPAASLPPASRPPPAAGERV